MRRLVFACLTCLAAPMAFAQCGGSFPGFVDGLKQQAISQGHAPATVDAFFRSVAQDPAVLRADRRQGVFQRPFLDFSRRLISQNRIDRGRQNARKYAAVFDRIEAQYGVSRGVLLAFWAFETDYGAVQGDFNTANALVTLAHDCRRPELFRPQVFAALTLYENGDFDPARTTGAWAGEIGQTQFLASSYVRYAVDYDRDGRRDLIRSVPDVLASTANYLAKKGWRRGQAWGPGTANYRVLREWNKASVYVQTISIMASKISGQG